MGFEQTSIKIEQPKLATWTHSFQCDLSDGALEKTLTEVHTKIRYPPHIGFGSEEEIWGDWLFDVFLAFMGKAGANLKA